MDPALPVSVPDHFCLLLIGAQERTEPLLRGLEQPGTVCYYAPHARAGMAEFQRIAPHLILLEYSLSDKDASDVCRYIRRRSIAPILVLGVANECEQLNALRAGADDCIGAPSLPVLRARVAAHLRRVYCYDELAFGGQDNTPGISPEDEPRFKANSGCPRGWARCDSCHYMGPQSKFQARDREGKITVACPCCGTKQELVFGVG